MTPRQDAETVTTAGILAVAVAAPVVLAAELPAVLRVPMALLLVGLVPGLALVRLAVDTDWLTTAVLAVAISLALDVLVAVTLLYTNVWSALFGEVVLAVVAVAAVLVRLATRGRAA